MSKDQNEGGEARVRRRIRRREGGLAKIRRREKTRTISMDQKEDQKGSGGRTNGGGSVRIRRRKRGRRIWRRVRGSKD